MQCHYLKLRLKIKKKPFIFKLQSIKINQIEKGNVIYQSYFSVTCKFRTDVEAARNETKETEERAKTANESVSTLEQDMKKVKVQYLQISENAKSALDTVDKALQAAANAEQANKQMNVRGFFYFIKKIKRRLSLKY